MYIDDELWDCNGDTIVCRSCSIRPQSEGGGSNPQYLTIGSSSTLGQDALYFVATNNSEGAELWVYDLGITKSAAGNAII